MGLLEKVKEAVVLLNDIVSTLEQGEKVYSEEEYQAKLALELAALSNSKDAEIAALKVEHEAAIKAIKAEFYADLKAQQESEAVSEIALLEKYKV